MRRAAKTDDNQKSIVSALRVVGCSVLPLHAVGQGCPDLLVTDIHKATLLMEIKDGSKPPSARKLTEPQVDFHVSWRGRIVVVTSVREALEAVGISESGWVA